MTPESFRTDLASAGLGRHVETIAALAKPCIQLETVPGDDTAGRVGATRLGGEPDLPPGEPWPEWQGTPMSFLVQIDLATVAGLPGADVLPSDGLLSFFCEGAIWRGDPTDGGDWRVLYTPAGASLERASIPDAVPEDGIFTACGLTPRPGVTLPYSQEPQILALGLSWDESGAYLDVRDPGDRSWPTEHRLLGWPDIAQNAEMELECQIWSTGIEWSWADMDRIRAELAPATAEWRLLLQLASDDAAGMMWGDVGVLYFWIREPDLAARDFSRVWMIMQCG
ncbi:MAG TPA: YwqG family protein [Longimicrobium sp.]|nr:YwqG family protein [Longimicrobium sp.]